MCDVTDRVGDADANNSDPDIFDESGFVASRFFVRWFSVGDENDDVRHVRSVTVGGVEYPRPGQSQSLVHVCAACPISEVSGGSSK